MSKTRCSDALALSGSRWTTLDWTLAYLVMEVPPQDLLEAQRKRLPFYACSEAKPNLLLAAHLKLLACSAASCSTSRCCLQAVLPAKMQ